MKIGQPNWTDNDLRAKLKEFSDLYMTRPIANNRGGMKSSHLFPTWFLIQKMQPEAIIESGTFQGQGTYFMEKAAPEALIFSIEPRPEQIQWRSDKVVYCTKDFSNFDWKKLQDGVLIHFDDHQNAFDRIKQMKELGFKYAMFEDNYPPGQDGMVTLKKCFHEKGKEADYLKKNIKLYYEFPPIFKLPYTRWGDKWDLYETPEPLYEVDGLGYENWMALMVGEAQSYTWICYVELK